MEQGKEDLTRFIYTAQHRFIYTAPSCSGFVKFDFKPIIAGVYTLQ